MNRNATNNQINNDKQLWARGGAFARGRFSELQSGQMGPASQDFEPLRCISRSK